MAQHPAAYAAAACIMNTNHRGERLRSARRQRKISGNGSEHHGFEVAVVDGGGKDDLGGGGAELLELEDQVLQLGHAAAAHLNKEGVGAGDMVALQHFLAVLHQLHQLVAVAGGDGKADEGSLRGSSEIVAARIREEIQTKVTDAGLEIIEARITYLAYAPEIAAVMLQRQQASAIIDARKMIVDGAVGMVEMALDQLSEKEVVELDEERKAAMVSNLLVVLCGNHDTQPIINSGSLY